MFFSGIEKSSLVDFENKVVCTLFTSGCNYKCPFCHNSSLVDGSAEFSISEEDVLAFLATRKGKLDGVSVTGGEPTLHRGLGDFLEKVKELGFIVKLDTNGTSPEALRELYARGVVDYFAMDIKTSFDRYPEITGVSDPKTDKVKESAVFLLSEVEDYEFRTTLINGFHDEETMARIAEDVKGAKNYFLQKFEDKGTCIQGGLSAVPAETAEAFAGILRQKVRRVSLRSYWY